MRPTLAALCLTVAFGLAACTDEEPSAEPTTEPSSSAASSTDTPTEEPAPALNACRVLGPGEVGRALGTSVEQVAAGGGCRFANPQDPATTSLGISQTELSEIGGIDGARQGVTSVVDGEVEEVPDVGDGAFVVVGPAFGGDTTGGGAVALGSSVVQVTVIPGPGATPDDVRATTVAVLTLIAKRARG